METSLRNFNKETYTVLREISETLSRTKTLNLELSSSIILSGIHLSNVQKEIRKMQGPEERKEMIREYESVKRAIRKILSRIKTERGVS
ncbi:hypothetical protein TRIP_B350097 [uncultured Desulfatiglans sp.]|nr:hypothetical protein TRIP_B350097 [uncultured Desulfatiglans sp.]